MEFDALVSGCLETGYVFDFSINFEWSVNIYMTMFQFTRIVQLCLIHLTQHHLHSSCGETLKCILRLNPINNHKTLWTQERSNLCYRFVLYYIFRYFYLILFFAQKLIYKFKVWSLLNFSVCRI